MSLISTELPTQLQSYLSGAVLTDKSCHSTAKTYQLSTGYYLKIDEQGTLQKEAVLTDYFYKNGLGVEVLVYLSEDRDYLVTRAADGQDATHFLTKPHELCRVLGKTLRQLHSLSWEELPTTRSLADYIATAKRNYQKGLFYEKALLPMFQIKSRDEAYHIMQTNHHLLREEVVIHGDFCLPNIILKNGQFSSLIDLGLAGKSDRHIDLFWAIWSLAFNLGTSRYTDRFLDEYGRDQVEMEKLKIMSAIEAFG